MNAVTLQKALNEFGGFGLVPDGDIGNLTKGAVVKMAEMMQLRDNSIESVSNKLSVLVTNKLSYERVIKELYQPVKKVAESFGITNIDPLIVIAQISLETAYLSRLCKDSKTQENSYNLGNIKAKDGEPFVTCMTTEYIGGVPKKMEQKFRKYAGYEDSLKGYFTLITSRYKYSATHANCPGLYFYGLKNDGYATDPNYVGSLLTTYYYLSLYKKLKNI